MAGNGIMRAEEKGNMTTFGHPVLVFTPPNSVLIEFSLISASTHHHLVILIINVYSKYLRGSRGIIRQR